jgi:hypothetical protein
VQVTSVLKIHTSEGIGLGDRLDKVISTYAQRASKRVDIYGTTVVTVDYGDGTALRFDSETARPSTAWKRATAPSSTSPRYVANAILRRLEGHAQANLIEPIDVRDKGA